MLRLITLRKILLRNSIYILLLILSSLYAFINIKLIINTSIYNENLKEFKLILSSFTIDGNTLTLNLTGKEDLIGYYYFEEEKDIDNFLNNYSLGDTLLLNGELIVPRNNTIPNTFNYKKYLYYNNMFYTLKIENFSLFKENKNILYSFKNYLYKKSYKSINKDYYYTFLLGNTKYIEKDFYDSYSNNGVSHLFSVSGLHVSLFAGIIFFILKIFKLKELSKYFITFIILLILCFVTSFTPSIMRSAIFFFLLGINKVFYFYVKPENILIIVFSILVFINPFIVMDLGFELSFIITYFILISLDNLKKVLYLKGLFKVSVISFFASLPIIVNTFYTVNIFSILINLIFVPFVSYIVYPFSFVSFILPFCDKIFHFLCNVMQYISLFGTKINIFVINIPRIPLYLIIIYYIVLLLIYKYNKRKCYIFILIILIINNMIAYFDNNFYVYFFDVGQGDSIFIKSPYNKQTIMIDVSGKMSYQKESWEIKNRKSSMAKNTLIPFFKSVGIKKMNYLFLTHGDEDHAGETDNLINNFNVDKIYINKGNINFLESKIDNKEILNQKVFDIDNIIIYSLNDKIYNNENDDSLVLLVIINNYKFLMMGDASKKVENDIIKKFKLSNIDVLKVGHHGSKTSSGDNFIKIIKPKECIISAGVNNKFNHPNEEVINILTKNNCKIFRTDMNGSIIYKIDNKKVNIETIKP